jgi:hypothetical protein
VPEIIAVYASDATTAGKVREALRGLGASSSSFTVPSSQDFRPIEPAPAASPGAPVEEIFRLVERLNNHYVDLVSDLTRTTLYASGCVVDHSATLRGAAFVAGQMQPLFEQLRSLLPGPPPA